MSYIDRQTLLLDKELVSYQNKILNQLIKTLYSSMDVKAGVIQDTANNYRVMGQINRTLAEVEVMNAEQIAGRIGRVTDRIDKFNLKQFGIAIGTSSKLERVAGLASGRMDNRLGYVGERLTKGGFLSNILGTEEIAAQANNLITKSVTAQVNMKTMISDLSELIDGGEKLGLMERKFDRLAFDIYQQYDAAYGEQLAEQFDMNYFIYQGGLVEDSRDFCREHNNRVWTREESEDWPTWTPAKAQFITDFKQKDIYSVPSYIDYPGYQPLIDRGGYNCRHAIGWISDELAFKMRPNLKEELKI